MINLQIIDPFSLPSVPLLDRKQLFRWGGVYFVIRDKQEILYIGQSPLIKSRWHRHDLLKTLDEDSKSRSRIHWLEVNEDLKYLEAIYIHRFRPILNKVYPSLSPTPKQHSIMKVVKVIEVESPNLGKRIKEAREANKRSLTDLCADAGMTTVNWCRIESEDTKSLPIETLHKIEHVLGVDFGVQLDN